MSPGAYSAAEREQYVHHLRGLFGDLGPEVVDSILALASTRSLEAGETLFAQGDPAGPLYVVLSGRLRAIVTAAVENDDPENPRRTVVLGDIAAGEPVGEMAVFTGEPRMASVIALRPSRLLCVTEAHYLQFVRQFPALTLSFNRFLVRRLRQNSQSTRSRALPRNVAVINLCLRANLSRWLDSARLTLDTMSVDTRLVARPANGCSLAAALDGDAFEHHEGINLLVCDLAADDWTRACLLCADLIILAVDFGADAAPHPLEAALGLHTSGVLGKRLFLLLVHPADAGSPANTARWLAGRHVSLHVHVREEHTADRRRFCRILANRAVGVVLGGGGARGYAHFGAVRALMDDGLEVDFLGGTSAGALYGALMSRHDFDWEHLAALGPLAARDAPTSRDYTLPFLALMSGRKMRRLLLAAFGETHLEDLWTNCFCVTSNYSTASPVVHDRGLARRYIEASIAIPGVFPPVLLGRQLHVDGGLFDNLPITAMLARPVRHVVAVSLMAQEQAGHDLDELPTTWQLLWDRVTRRRKYRLPSLPALLLNAMILNSRHQHAVSVDHAALHLELDLRGFGLLDWSRWQDAYQAGQEQARARLAALPPQRKFWLPPS